MTMLSQVKDILPYLCLFKGYTKQGSTGACCTSGSTDHQTCQCTADISFCRSHCDFDEDCKGYVDMKGRYGGYCMIATTSECPNSCEFQNYVGNVGALVPNVNCDNNGNAYKGCFIKN